MSMTGFGTAHAKHKGLLVTCEIKTLNQRGLDIKLRLPREIAALEPLVTPLLKEQFVRGRVEANYNMTASSAYLHEPVVDLAAIQHIQRQLQGLGQEIPISQLMLLPNMVRFEESPLLYQELQPLVLKATESAIQRVVKTRQEEGSQLQKSLYHLLKQCEKATLLLQKQLKNAPAEHFKLMQVRLTALLANRQLEETRLLQEVAILADKTDVTEELERLKMHCSHFRTLCEQSHPGRQLEFLCQELLREANTTASKCQDIKSQHIVVNLKSDIERIRELVQNIE